MQIKTTRLPGVLVLEPRVFADPRGAFHESYNARLFRELTGVTEPFVQDNHSVSRHGVLRGLHYQLPRAQGKLVRVVQGAVTDVVVDLRAGSPMLGRWEAVELSADNGCQLWVPPGFAHGFQVTSAEGATFLYKTTDYWSPADEHCIRWDDPDLAIAWPLPAAALVSDKDARGGSFREAIKFPAAPGD